MSDFKAKMHQIRFPLGFRPRLRWGSLRSSPDPLTLFKGPTSNGGKGKGERKGRGREGRGDLPLTQLGSLDPSVVAAGHVVIVTSVFVFSNFSY